MPFCARRLLLIVALALLAPLPALAGSPLEHELRLLERDAARAGLALDRGDNDGLILAEAVRGDLRQRLASIEARQGNLPQTPQVARRLRDIGAGIGRLDAHFSVDPSSQVGAMEVAAGSISGRVTAADSGLPLAGARIRAIAGTNVKETITAVDGTYRITPLAVGTYEVSVDATDDGYVRHSHPEPVAVGWVEETSGIDVAVPRGGQITGGVAALEESAANAVVAIYAADGTLAALVSVDLNGTPYLTPGLAAGTYFALASADGFSDQLFDGIDCTTCSPLSGTPIEVVTGGFASADFTMNPHGRISGNVTEPGATWVISGATVSLFDAGGNLHQTAFTDVSGSYAIASEQPGTYFVGASAVTQRYSGELYRELSCEPSCDVTAGTPVVIAPGGHQTGIDFTLASLVGRIRGRVSATESGLPLHAGVIYVSTSGTWLGSSQTSSRGEYDLRVEEPGTYYAMAYGTDRFSEVFRELPCHQGQCQPLDGIPLQVSATSIVTPVNFTLDPKGSISGRITDALSGAPLQNVRVTVRGDHVLEWTTSDANGAWRVDGLGTGTYEAYARTLSNTHVSEVWNDTPCWPSDCSGVAGDPIEVTIGEETRNIDFPLTPMGKFSGRVSSSAFGDAGVRLQIYDATGLPLDGNPVVYGSYERPISPGIYYVKAESSSYIDELYADVPCEEGCAILSGSPVVIAAGGETTGIDFVLEPLVGAIEGRVTDLLSGEPLSYAHLTFFGTDGTFKGLASSGLDGTYRGILPAGEYRVHVSGTSRVDMAYPGIRCLADCSPSEGDAVVVNAGLATSNIDFALPSFATGIARQTYGSVAGGNTVTLTGKGYRPEVTVLFGGVPGTVQNTWGDGVTVITPAREAGAVEVTVFNGDGDQTTLVEPFIYESPLRPQPRLVKDLNPTSRSFSGGVGTLIVAGEEIYFTRRDAERGAELWVSDGTKAGSRPIPQLAPGVDFEHLRPFIGAAGYLLLRGVNAQVWRTDGTADGTFQLTSCNAYWNDPAVEMGNQIYFTCQTPETGTELWATDGTVEGTRIVRDIDPGAGSGFPMNMAVLGNWLYFVASSPGAGSEIWRTDGTEAGTTLAIDLIPGPDFVRVGQLTAAGGRLYFTAANAAGDRVIYSSDGSPDGTNPILGPQRFGGFFFLELNGSVYFLSSGLWKTDGTAAGTTKLTNPFNPAQLIKAGPYLYVRAGYGGQELWRTDGSSTGTLFLATINGYEGLLDPVELGNLLLFRDAEFDYEGEPGDLWRSDGTPEGTVQLSAKRITRLARRGNEAFLISYEENAPSDLWKSDGTAEGTVQVTDFGSSPSTYSSSPTALTPAGGRVFFLAAGAGGEGLYVSDGTEAGTHLVKTTPRARVLTAFADGILFTDGIPSHLWKSDGTAENTYSLGPVRYDTTIMPAGGLAYFTSSSGELFRTDGTVEGTIPVGAGPSGMAVLDGALYFSTASGLYRTTGTSDSTAVVKEGIDPRHLTEAGGRLYFVAGEQLWSSDGTAENTIPIKPVPLYGTPLWSTLGGRTYFIMRSQNEPALWVTDGSSAGTTLVTTLPDPPNWVTASGGFLYFDQPDFTSQRQTIWVSDGTPEGTAILPDALTEHPTRPRVNANGVFFFVDRDPRHGSDFWRSDGTAEGTYLYHDEDVYDGPTDATLVGSTLFFSGDGHEGRELRAIEVGPPAAIASISPTSGPHQGGMPLTVHGANFMAGVETTFGQKYLKDPVWGDPAQITGTTPALQPGRLYDVTVHNGETSTLPRAFFSDFLDVPQAAGIHPFVESIFRAGITTGCGGGSYCPSAPTTRAQMAIFLLRAMHGGDYVPPPATGTMFADVPASLPAAAWIEQLARENISAGCGGGNFCPAAPVTRAQMAVFLLKAKHGAGYVPPAATGIFGDVPPGSFAANWIERLYAEGISGGCSTTPLLFCPAAETTRGQMAVFLTKAAL